MILFHIFNTLTSLRASVVGVRNKGDCPCPRCLVSLNEVHNMGTDADRITRMERHREDNEETKERLREARKVICKDHFSVNSGGVESLLKPTSLVPAQVGAPIPPRSDTAIVWLTANQNAFSERLSRFGFDVYRIPAVDIMHEVEIGVWKSLFIQLLRLLEATQKSLLNILNQRFVHTTCPTPYLTANWSCCSDSVKFQVSGGILFVVSGIMSQK